MFGRNVRSSQCFSALQLAKQVGVSGFKYQGNPCRVVLHPKYLSEICRDPKDIKWAFENRPDNVSNKNIAKVATSFNKPHKNSNDAVGNDNKQNVLHSASVKQPKGKAVFSSTAKPDKAVSNIKGRPNDKANTDRFFPLDLVIKKTKSKRKVNKSKKTAPKLESGNSDVKFTSVPKTHTSGQKIIPANVNVVRLNQNNITPTAVSVQNNQAEILNRDSNTTTSKSGVPKTLASQHKVSSIVDLTLEIPSNLNNNKSSPTELLTRDQNQQQPIKTTEPISKVDILSKIDSVREKFDENRRHRIYAFGLTETGALGLHKPNEGRRWRKFMPRPLRHQFAEENRIISAEAGYGFTLFYVKTGSNVKLYGCGINMDFQLGPSSLEMATYPIPMDIRIASPSTKIVSFSAGRAHSVVATDAEGIFLLGSNLYGQCGRRIDKDDKSEPTCTITQMRSVDGEQAESVTCGQDHTLFITKSGKVFSCGCGIEGQTGLGNNEHTSTASIVKGDIQGETIVKVAGRCDTVLALNNNGELFGWGSNEFRQLIDDQDVSQFNTPRRLLHVNQKCGKIIDISAGSSFCMVLNEEGNVFVWGSGLLGVGPQLTKTSTPTLIPRTLFGCNEYEPNVKASRVFCGVDHMVAVNNVNHAYAWGKNKYGCLGIGHPRDQYFPYKLAFGADALHVSCAVDHSVIVTNHFN